MERVPAMSVRPTKLGAFATEAFALDKHYFDKPLEEKHSPLSRFIAVLRKNYALVVEILRDPSVGNGNGSLKKGNFRVRNYESFLERMRNIYIYIFFF